MPNINSISISHTIAKFSNTLCEYIYIIFIKTENQNQKTQREHEVSQIMYVIPFPHLDRVRLMWMHLAFDGFI